MTELLLDGLPLDHSATVGWRYSVGVGPHFQVHTCDRGVAEEIFARAQPGESILDYSVTGGSTLRVEGLHVMGTGPSVAPDKATIQLADRRWFLGRRRIRRAYNVRRDTGNRRRPLVGVPPELQVVRDDQGFAPFSVQQSGRRHTAATALRDVLEGLTAAHGETFEIRQLPEQMLPVESLVLDDTGAGALLRVFAYFGGRLGMWCEGKRFIVFDRLDRSEATLVGLEGGKQGTRTREQGTGRPSIQGPRLWQVQDRSMERACRVRVLISRLAEFRLDHTEGEEQASSGATSTGDAAGIRPKLSIENVLPNPDFELAIPAMVTPDGFVKKARTVLQGTWITIEEAIAAWNALGWPDTGVGDLTLARLREEWVGAGLAEYAPPLLDEDGLYRRRINALKAHIRQTYRVSRWWRDRLGLILPHRVSYIDPETNTRTPAFVAADHADRLTSRGAENEILENPENVAVWVNRLAAPAGQEIKDTPISELRQAPATVTIVDQDEGVFRLSYGVDPRGGEAEVLFSAVLDSTIPKADPTDGPLTLEGSILAPTHQVSVVLSAVPASPNDRRQLHEEVIEPSGVAQLVGDRIGTCRAPEIELRVPPMNLRAVARHEWDDDRAEAIREAFEFGGGGEEGFGEPLNPDEVSALARAAAARYYMGLVDHVEGELYTGWDPSIRPTGSVGSVTFGVSPEGEAVTTVSFPPDHSNLVPDLWTLLPENVRHVALGEVIP